MIAVAHTQICFLLPLPFWRHFHLNIRRYFLLGLAHGVCYHSSSNVFCEQCYQRKHKNGTVTYSHSAITPVIVAPGNPHVISLPPEFITPQDGHDKQDSEHAATKRWLLEHAKH